MQDQHWNINILDLNVYIAKQLYILNLLFFYN